MSPFLFLLAPTLVAGCSSEGDPVVPTALDDAFQAAAEEYEVPRDLLVAISWSLTRLDDRSGMEAVDSAVGLMNLRADGRTPSLPRGAELAGLSVDDAAYDPASSVRAGAAVLRELADQREAELGIPVDDLQAWFPVVEAYSGSNDPVVSGGFADQVYDVLQWGLMAEASTGDFLVVEPREMQWRPAEMNPVTGSSLVDNWVSASSSNYTNDSRTSVTTVVVHTMEGSYSGSISWFQNSSAGASAHYMVRSSDGEITQMVDEQDIAWHAGHWETNSNSIGIEHEGYVSDPGTWYTDAMYRSSAALVKDICDRYGIPKDRDHIIGHNEVPGCSNPNGGGSSCHTDPGGGWDWDYFMSLVKEEGSSTSSALPDGTKTGTFTVRAHSSRYAETDTCSGTLTGTAHDGNLYLQATCRGDNNPDAGELAITWSGATMGTAISGNVLVDGYTDPWSGTVNSNGSVSATMTGTKDVGGDVGVVTYEATLYVEP